MRLRKNSRPRAAGGDEGGRVSPRLAHPVGTRQDVTMQSIDHPVRVAIAIVEQNGQFLVGVRPEGVPLAGLAEFPGGKVHDDEAAAAAAVRECHEETGLRVVVDREFYSITHRYDHGLLAIQFFLCRLADGEQSTAISPFRWVTAGELAVLEFPAANIPVTEMLLVKPTPAIQST